MSLMSKKKKHNSTGPKSRTPRPAGSARTSSSASSVSRASREVKSTAEARLMSQFARWYMQHLDTVDEEDTHGELEAMLGTLDVLMDMTRTLGPRMTLATPTPHTLQTLIDHTIQLSDEQHDVAALAAEVESNFDMDADELDPDELELSDRIEALVDVLEHYLDFLSETNGWRASDDEFNASYAVLAQAVNDLTVAGAMVGLLLEAIDGVETVAPAEQLRALNALPIIAGVDGLLSWLGESKPVTATGSVRLADIQPVAALIGINAVGKRGAENSDLAHHLYEAATANTPVDAASDAEPQPACTMWDISALGTWWVTLSQAGIIAVGATTVRPGPDASAWRSEDATEQLSARSDFVERYVQEWLEREATNDSPAAAHTLTRVISMLVAAVSPDTLALSGSAAVADAIDEELHYDSEDASAAFAASLVLHQLTKAGLLETVQAPDGTARYTAAEELRPTLALTIAPLVAALI